MPAAGRTPAGGRVATSDVRGARGGPASGDAGGRVGRRLTRGAAGSVSRIPRRTRVPPAQSRRAVAAPCLAALPLLLAAVPADPRPLLAAAALLAASGLALAVVGRRAMRRDRAARAAAEAALLASEARLRALLEQTFQPTGLLAPTGAAAELSATALGTFGTTRDEALGRPLLAGVLAIAADAIVTVDADQRIVLFNQGAEKIFGHRAADVLGRPLDLLVPPRLRAAHRRHVEAFGTEGDGARRMGGAGGGRREIFGLRRDGEEFPAEASISTLDHDGRRLHTVVLRDITEQTRHERGQRFLAEAGAVLAGSLDYASTLEHVARLTVPILGDACILELDTADGAPEEVVVAHADRALEPVMRELRLRYPPPPLGDHPLVLVRRTGQPLLLRELSPDMLAGPDAGDAERALLDRLRMRSGLLVPLRVRGRTIGVLGGYTSRRALDEEDLALAAELGRRAALAIDNARAYAAARQASLARDEVLGIVSHDLRNPISAIGMCARALEAQPPGDEAAELARMIRRSTAWMQHIIRDLLDVTAIEARRLAVDPAPTTATAIVDAVLAIHAPIAGERELVLTTEVTPALPPLHVDPDRMVQAVGNLLGNAIRFTPRGGRVALAVTCAPGGVAFTVTDAGPGIPAADLPHLFDRFWQARATRRGGAGLGLAIARGIAEAHGGCIEVRSTVGEGSRFALVLPTGSEAGTR